MLAVTFGKFGRYVLLQCREITVANLELLSLVEMVQATEGPLKLTQTAALLEVTLVAWLSCLM